MPAHLCVSVCAWSGSAWKSDDVTPYDQLTFLSNVIGDAEKTQDHRQADSVMADEKVMAPERDEEHAPPAVRKSFSPRPPARLVTLHAVIVHHDSLTAMLKSRHFRSRGATSSFPGFSSLFLLLIRPPLQRSGLRGPRASDRLTIASAQRASRWMRSTAARLIRCRTPKGSRTWTNGLA